MRVHARACAQTQQLRLQTFKKVTKTEEKSRPRVRLPPSGLRLAPSVPSSTCRSLSTRPSSNRTHPCSWQNEASAPVRTLDCSPFTTGRESSGTIHTGTRVRARTEPLISLKARQRDPVCLTDFGISQPRA